MRTFLAFALLVSFAISHRTTGASILAGPITNSANGHVYYLLSPDTWTASEEEAVRLGGHLVTVNDETENTWLAETFGEWALVSRGLWIGLSDSSQEGTYQWASGETSSFGKWWRGSVNTNGWTDLGEAVVGNGAIQRVYDSASGAGMRIYRVIEVDMIVFEISRQNTHAPR